MSEGKLEKQVSIKVFIQGNILEISDTYTST